MKSIRFAAMAVLSGIMSSVAVAQEEPQMVHMEVCQWVHPDATVIYTIDPDSPYYMEGAYVNDCDVSPCSANLDWSWEHTQYGHLGSVTDRGEGWSNRDSDASLVGMWAVFYGANPYTGTPSSQTGGSFGGSLVGQDFRINMMGYMPYMGGPFYTQATFPAVDLGGHNGWAFDHGTITIRAHDSRETSVSYQEYTFDLTYVIRDGTGNIVERYDVQVIWSATSLLWEF
jgi:hypothetical protein